MLLNGEIMRGENGVLRVESGVGAFESLRRRPIKNRGCEKTQNRFSITFFVVILNLIQNLSRDVKR